MKTRSILILAIAFGTVAHAQIPPIKPIQPIKPIAPIQPIKPFSGIQGPIQSNKAKQQTPSAQNPNIAQNKKPVAQVQPAKPATPFSIPGPVQPTQAPKPPINSLRTLNGNQFDPDSVSNPYGAGSPYKPDGVNNQFGPNGSPYSNTSATNPYATKPPILVDSNGKYLGELTTNQFSPDSVSNPFGKYGNPYLPDSINNPLGAGNPNSPKKIYIVPQGEKKGP